MTTSIQPPTAETTINTGTGMADIVEEKNVAQEKRVTRSPWRWLWIILVILLLFVVTYALSWYNAYQLSLRFVGDADSSYAAGDYLDALVGYQTFDPQVNEYVNVGGYLAVERIWSGRYSWPKPDAVQHAFARSEEIIQQRLTIEEAEEYIQANIGRSAPYFGEIYLRLGELYEESGSVVDARDIYESIPDLFANRPDLIARAEQHLARLQGQ